MVLFKKHSSSAKQVIPKCIKLNDLLKLKNLADGQVEKLVPTIRRQNVFHDALAYRIAKGRQSVHDLCSNAGALERNKNISTWPKVLGYFTDRSRRVCNPPHTDAGLQTRRERCWKTYGQVLRS